MDKDQIIEQLKFIRDKNEKKLQLIATKWQLNCVTERKTC